MPDIRVAIAGLGAIGRMLALKLSAGMPGLTLACAAAGDRAKAQAFLDAEGITCPIVPLDQFPALADIAVECAPAAIIEEICRPMLEAGKSVIVLSCGALLPRPELLELAKAKGGRIIVPTGALLGLDAVVGRRRGQDHLGAHDHPQAAGRAEGCALSRQNDISVDGLNEAKRVFSGSAREAAAGFPANVNVAAALSLAGIGPDRTQIDIWADPFVTRNCHDIEVEADSARFRMSIENVPSDNPKTGRIVALSVLAALRKLGAPLSVGT